MVFFCLLLTLSIMQEALSTHIMRSYAIDRRGNNLYYFIYSSLQIVWVMIVGYFCLPVPVLFAGIYLQQIIFLNVTNRIHKNLFRYLIMVSILFSSGYSISYGLLKICLVLADKPMENASLHLLALVGAKFIMIIFCFLPWEKMVYQQRAKSEDSTRESLFIKILIFFLLYIFVDGCLCIYNPNGIFVPLMMVTGNLLLLLLYGLFVRQEYLVEQSQYLEEEQRRLLAEAALEEYKAKNRELMVERDSLTGAYSRRYAIKEMQRMKQEHTLFSLVYIDLDGLKKVNDELGHEAGDNYLKRFVNEISDYLSPRDVLARVGGDEFLMLLMGCDYDCSIQQMVQIRSQLSSSNRAAGALPFSFGVAFGGSTTEEIIEMADKNMYLDKRRTKEVYKC